MFNEQNSNLVYGLLELSNFFSIICISGFNYRVIYQENRKETRPSPHENDSLERILIQFSSAVRMKITSRYRAKISSVTLKT